jgi:hypothetical protein
MRVCFALMIVGLACASFACRDASRFSNRGDRYEGTVVKGSFVRSGIGEDVAMCLVLDMDRLQDAPGTISTSDGRFKGTSLRPIPQIWHDPLSTLSFGDGRVQNLVYAAGPIVQDGGPEEAQDVVIVISLMQSEQLEVRLLRGAPQADAAPPPAGVAPAVFGVFTLERRKGPCAF